MVGWRVVGRYAEAISSRGLKCESGTTRLVADRTRPYATLERSSRRDDSETVRRDAVERVERTLDVQRERLDSVDRKAAKLLRLVAAATGVVLAVFGAGSIDSGTVSRVSSHEMLTATVVITALALLATVILASMTYVTTQFGSSFTAETTTLVRRRELTEPAYLKLLLDTYATTVARNRPRIRRNERLFVATLALLVLVVSGVTAGIVFLSLGQGLRRQVALAVVTVLYLSFLAVIVHLRRDTK